MSRDPCVLRAPRLRLSVTCSHVLRAGAFRLHETERLLTERPRKIGELILAPLPDAWRVRPILCPHPRDADRRLIGVEDLCQVGLRNRLDEELDGRQDDE